MTGGKSSDSFTMIKNLTPAQKGQNRITKRNKKKEVLKNLTLLFLCKLSKAVFPRFKKWHNICGILSM